MKYLDFANSVQTDEKPEVLVTVTDGSLSMDENDWKPTRKAGAIKANKELINAKLKSHPDDKIGIIGFGGEARILHAPIRISNGVKSLNRALNFSSISGGTNFTAALELAESCLFGEVKQPVSNFFSKMLSEIFIETDNHKQPVTKDDGCLKRIIMLTDGQHNVGRLPLAIASRLKNKGVIIDCIGIGGSPADVDEELLKQIASKNSDGSIRYCFIGDQQQLIRKYQSLAQHIRAI